MQDIGTRDGLRIIVQAYVAWQVQGDADNVQRFMRAVQNQPDEAARGRFGYLCRFGAETTASFDLSSLINTDASQVRIADFEAQLRQQIDQQLLCHLWRARGAGGHRAADLAVGDAHRHRRPHARRA